MRFPDKLLGLHRLTSPAGQQAANRMRLQIRAQGSPGDDRAPDRQDRDRLAHADVRALRAPAIIRHVSIKVGGIHVSSVATGPAQKALRELRELAGPLDPADYLVDLCFLTYVKGGLGSEYAAGTGVRPGMVGRKQRRFIINLEVPPDLTDRAGIHVWITVALEQAAEITRACLPRKSKQYPAPPDLWRVDRARLG